MNEWSIQCQYYNFDVKNKGVLLRMSIWFPITYYK